MINAVLDSSVDHEIVPNSFSHVVFGHPEIRAEITDAALGKFDHAAADYDFELNSLVYPRSVIVHQKTFTEHGYYSRRGPSTNR